MPEPISTAGSPDSTPLRSLVQPTREATVTYSDDELDEIRDHNQRLADEVAARCSFQLRYSRADKPRRFSPEELTGDRLDDAQTPGATFTGNWSAGDHPGQQFMTTEIRRLDERDWLNHYAHLAVGEAIHEALEWFQVDGEPWLDPHGDMQSYIYDEVEHFAKRLAGVRAQFVAEEAQRARDEKPAARPSDPDSLEVTR